MYLFISVIVLIVLLQQSEGRKNINSICSTNNNNCNQLMSFSTSKSLYESTINLKQIRGGNESSKTINKKEIILKNLFTFWGVFQVVSSLSNGIKRILPIALEPFKNYDLNIYQSIAYVLFSIFMGYAEGYKGFQLKLSPLIVKRASGLYENRSILNLIFSGPYSMGLFNANKKRMIVSWSVSFGIFGLTYLVKKMPYPYRSIIDGGVVVGLTWGASSIIYQFVKSIITGNPPDVDPCLPNNNNDKENMKQTTKKKK